jgi:hypothetical protein
MTFEHTYAAFIALIGVGVLITVLCSWRHWADLVAFYVERRVADDVAYADLRAAGGIFPEAIFRLTRPKKGDNS